jgi:thiol:disulfide interchange protein/DsbC/DsbD-like thiol-disulfide interchange protein
MALLRTLSPRLALIGLLLLLSLAFWGGVSSAARSAPVQTENVEAELHASRAAVAPGQTFTLVLRQKLREGWHTYWRNFGDSGDVTTVEWTLPAGLTLGEMQFPMPKKIPVPPLMTYGFEGEVLYPIRATVARNALPGQPLQILANVSSVVCSDICVIEEQALTFSIPVAAVGLDDPVWAGRAAGALSAIPKAAEGVNARISRQGERATLTVVGGPFAGLTGLKDAYFFPFDGGAIKHAAPQAPTAGPEGLAFTLEPAIADTLGKGPLSGVVRIDRAGAPPLAVEITAEVGAVQPGVSGVWAQASGTGAGPGAGSAALDQSQVTTLAMALLFAFIGGLILNVMPCVFPVLSMKALGLAKTAHTGQSRRHGLLFFAGVMATFLTLAGVMIALSMAGAQVGWGFQLQEPLVVAGLALVFFVIGLNLLGVFEVGAGLQGLGDGLAARGGDAGAFFTGVLAVVAASPCTIPFMSGAVGFAAVATPAESLATFAALGAGFGLPFTALAFAPGLLKLLPKPGPWMETFKQAMAFPMFATAVWLAWVLATGKGADGALAVLVAALAAGLLIWSLKTLRGPIARSIGAGVAALAMALALSLLLPKAEVRPQPWSTERVAALRAEGKAVFVNFTAAWCVSCKANEWNALERPAVKEAFARVGVVYLKGDWTLRDAPIAEELARFGRNGVPLYLYYPAGEGQGGPKVLPELLTEDIVLAALAQR